MCLCTCFFGIVMFQTFLHITSCLVVFHADAFFLSFGTFGFLFLSRTYIRCVCERVGALSVLYTFAGVCVSFCANV